MTSFDIRSRHRSFSKWMAAGLLCVGVSTAAAQSPALSMPGIPAKPLTFDVVSIRENLSPPRYGPPQFGPTADGYHMVAGPLLLPIITAYLPQSGGAVAFMPDQIKGLPEWAMRGNYDIDAKVAEEDLAQWQKPEFQKTLLPAMLQALLEDRCKMVVHRETKDLPVYLLTVGKGGPKFKETDPSVEHPDGMKLPWGGVMVPGRGGAVLYGTSMASFATLLSTMGGQGIGRQVQDKTGLTGRYDITITLPGSMEASQGPGEAGGARDPGSTFFSVVEGLGLKLEPGKEPVETLVIDHIEKPTAN